MNRQRSVALVVEISTVFGDQYRQASDLVGLAAGGGQRGGHQFQAGAAHVAGCREWSG
jgi:hypothetical protein